MHWGWYWKIKQKHISKKICSRLPSIDSFKLYKNNLMTGFNVQPLEINAQPTPDRLLITFRKQQHPSYAIPVIKLPCNYGGCRYYFKCPLCQRRMRILYFAEQSVFLCRKCLNLAYKSQMLRPTSRYEYMSNKVKNFIKNKDGDLGQYKKPPHMHKTTYEKVRSKQFYYENKSAQASNAELRLWHGPQIEPYLDEFFDYVCEDKPWQH